MQKKGKLIPGVSTHFRWVGETDPYTVIEGKVYRIIRWEEIPPEGFYYVFQSESGRILKWIGTWDLEDCSYEENLKEILIE